MKKKMEKKKDKLKIERRRERERKISSPHLLGTSDSLPNPQDMMLQVSEAISFKLLCRIFLAKYHSALNGTMEPKPEEYQQYLGLQAAGQKFLPLRAVGTWVPSQMSQSSSYRLAKLHRLCAWAFAAFIKRQASTKKQLTAARVTCWILGMSACPAALYRGL